MSDTAEDALRRARGHLHRATLEGLEAARALLEAAMRTSGMSDASEDSLVGNLKHSLESLIAGLRENASFVLPSALVDPLAAAVEEEIKRWEERSRSDPDARPVLRAFLGLRELLWELGMRRDAPPEQEAAPAGDRQRRPAQARSERVQRFDIHD